ncbi:MAG TPA: PEP-CTERM sorting domain-containing protein [Candidatus Acidoferrales bacterium]
MSKSTATIRLFAVALLAAAFILLPGVTRADSTATYDISGSLVSGGTFSGTFEFDQSGSTLQLINTTFTLDGLQFGCSGAASNTCQVFDPFGVSFVSIGQNGPNVVFTWLDSNFNILNPPNSFNFLGGYCTGCGYFGIDGFLGGTATKVTSPEPGVFLMLGLGLVALAILSRRQLRSLQTAA